ncbi:conserved hypothetical protein, partial [Trichinella spiralis]
MRMKNGICFLDPLVKV